MKIKPLVFALIFVLAVIIASCASKSYCPAYGKAETKTENNA